MSGPNGTPPSIPAEPHKIATEVYILDGLIVHMKAVASQLQFMGKLRLAEQISNLAVVVGPGQAMLLQQFREQLNTETYGKTPGGLILPGPGDVPRG